MVSWAVIGGGIIGIIVSSIFFFGSFGFVDENNAFTTGGFSLFVGSLAGYAISIYIIVKGISSD